MGKNPKVLNVVNKEAADLENIPIEEVFKNLRCNREGLTSTDAQERLATFWHNKPEEKESKFLNFLGYLRNPLSLVMGGAAVMAISLANGGGRPPDWQASIGIIALLLIESTISFIVKNNTRKEAAARFVQFVPKARVLRDGNWSEEDDSVLVPGDIISIKTGDTVPADARLLEGDPLKIYQFALTGESLPVTKGPGDCVYTGSICQQGEMEAVVIATGVHTSLRKGDHITDSSKQVQRVLEASGNFCICFVAVVFIIDIIVMYCIQHRKYRPGIDNLLVLLIGGIPVGMPAIHSTIVYNGASYLDGVGAIANRMTAILDMAGMDVLCSDKTGILTLNMLRVQDNLIEVFAEDIDKDTVFLMAVRAASRINCGTMDAPYFQDLNYPQEARASLREVDFVPYSPTDKRTTLTYLDGAEKMHRVSTGPPEDILNLAHNMSDTEHRVHAVIDMFAEKGMRSVAVAYQEVPDGKKESSGGPWQFIGVLPFLDLPRHDSAATIRALSNLGVNVKMITGDQLVFTKETGRRLGMGTNVYPSSALVGQNRDSSTAKLIEKADGFASVLPEHRYEILKHLQSRKHICGMTGKGVDDIPALNKADIGISYTYDATHVACSAADIILSFSGLRDIHDAVLTSRSIAGRMKNYTVYVVSIAIRNVISFTLLALVWKFDFPPFMVLIITIFEVVFIGWVAQDWVKPSHLPVTWNLTEILTSGMVLGGYLAMSTVLFFWAACETNIFQRLFGVSVFEKTTTEDFRKLASAIYLQVSTSSYALIFVTRTLSWRPCNELVFALLQSQLLASLMAVYANWSFASIEGIGWGWAGVIWLYNLVVYVPLYFIKFFNQHTHRGFLKSTI